MATGLLALLDDITSILDDVSAMTKVAASKTAGVLGDDLVLNAQQVAEVRADRGLPVVWAVAKGSAVNKAILVPAALAISAFAPWLVTPLLMLGGIYLCFEGVEKLAHPWLHEAVPGPHAPLLSEGERAKVRAAVRTDFVLSAEIIVITLGTVAGRPLATQIGVMIGIAALMTVGVYGLVAGIVRLDDIGLYLSQFPDGARRRLGRAILAMAPHLMRTLSVVGTAAMFLVGGGGSRACVKRSTISSNRLRMSRYSEACSDRWQSWSPTALLGSWRARACSGCSAGRTPSWLHLGSDTRAIRPGIDRERRNSPTRRAGRDRAVARRRGLACLVLPMVRRMPRRAVRMALALGPRAEALRAAGDVAVQTRLKTLHRCLRSTPLLEAEYQLEASVTDAAVAMALAVSPGSPIFLIERTSYSIGHRPIDYEKLHYRGDHIRFKTRLMPRGKFSIEELQ